MKEELTVVILAIRKEKIDRSEESFEDFLDRLRAKYTKRLKTKRVTMQIVERHVDKGDFKTLIK